MPIRPDRTSRPAVVVTRPLQQAQAFASRVDAIGRHPEIFPLLCIAPVDDVAPLRATLADLRAYALVVFVSPNAIDAAFEHIAAWPSDVAIGVVGEGSRLALHAHGVTENNTRIYAPQQPDKMDSEELLKALPLVSLRGRRVLIVRGQAGRDFLSNALRAAGVDVDYLTAYQRCAPEPTPACRAQLLALIDGDSEWVITSSEALRNLLALARLAGDDDRVVKLQRQTLFVSHQRIAQTAHALGFGSVVLTGSGDERLIAALQSSP